MAGSRDPCSRKRGLLEKQAGLSNGEPGLLREQSWLVVAAGTSGARCDIEGGSLRQHVAHTHVHTHKRTDTRMQARIQVDPTHPNALGRTLFHRFIQDAGVPEHLHAHTHTSSVVGMHANVRTLMHAQARECESCRLSTRTCCTRVKSPAVIRHLACCHERCGYASVCTVDACA